MFLVTKEQYGKSNRQIDSNAEFCVNFAILPLKYGTVQFG